MVHTGVLQAGQGVDTTRTVVVRPHRRTGTLVGAAIVFSALLVAGMLGWQLSRHPVSLASFTAALVEVALLALAALFAYWTYGCWSLCYILDGDRLRVRWAGKELSMPLREIESVTPATSMPRIRDAGGVSWPGYYIGRAAVTGMRHPGEVLVFATSRSPRELLYIQTPGSAYALSIPARAAFAEELELRRQQQHPEGSEPQPQQGASWDLAFWRDRRLLGPIALGLVANLALFGYLAYLMPALPALVPMHFTPLGLADRTGDKTELLLLPAGGLLLLLLNTGLAISLHRREPLAAYLAIGASLAVQGILWAAAFVLVG